MTTSARSIGTIAALLGALAVIAGAFGAHALRDTLSDPSLQAWRTAVDYQFWHVLALLGIAAWTKGDADVRVPLRVAVKAFAIGIVLFSGSLYALALGAPRWLGPVTPIGGLLLIVGWIALLVAMSRSR